MNMSVYDIIKYIPITKGTLSVYLSSYRFNKFITKERPLSCRVDDEFFDEFEKYLKDKRLHSLLKDLRSFKKIIKTNESNTVANTRL